MPLSEADQSILKSIYRFWAQKREDEKTCQESLSSAKPTVLKNGTSVDVALITSRIMQSHAYQIRLLVRDLERKSPNVEYCGLLLLNLENHMEDDMRVYNIRIPVEFGRYDSKERMLDVNTLKDILEEHIQERADLLQGTYYPGTKSAR